MQDCPESLECEGVRAATRMKKKNTGPHGQRAVAGSATPRGESTWGPQLAAAVAAAGMTYLEGRPMTFWAHSSRSSASPTGRATSGRSR